jgi:hypothetical protein
MTNDELDGIKDAALAVYWDWDRFIGTSDPLLAASALISLSNSMSDLSSWLPGYNVNTGKVEETGYEGN